MKSARQICLEILVKVQRDSSYSNIVLDEAIKSSELSPSDIRFTSALFYGVLERKITLDIIIQHYLKKPIEKMQIEVLQILRLGIYQILFMDSVPNNASVNESVKLAKKNKNPSISGLVNAVLRNFIRDGAKIPTFDDEKKNLSVQYSAPIWLIKKWLKEYGKDHTISMLNASIATPPVTAVVNTTKIDTEELITELDKVGIISNKVDGFPNVIMIKNLSNIKNLELYKQGMFHIQDLSSFMCCEALGVSSDNVVIDICSAPGGKSFTIAEMMDNQGKIYSYDIHENRVKLIIDGAKRLGLSIIDSAVNDGAEFNSDIPLADKILCDVPCSGLGVIRRKPEIKYKDKAEFDNLPEIQYNILCVSAKYLKVGGELVYSTCTLSRQENDEVIDKFLAENPDYEGVSFLENRGYPYGEYKASIISEFFNSDGFFISKIKRIR